MLCFRDHAGLHIDGYLGMHVFGVALSLLKFYGSTAGSLGALIRIQPLMNLQVPGVNDSTTQVINL